MRSPLTITLLVTAILALPIGGILAQSPMLVPDQVEEDWQLVIATPDTTLAGPQITTTMSPVSDSSTPFVALDMNYREYPSFQPGGMQLQVWDVDSKNVLSYSTQGTDQLNTPGETVTWTQRMSLGSDGTVSYSVVNGQSTTWGQFGQGNGQFSVSFPSTLSSLSGYQPATSVNNSAASWQSNHVTSMTLVQVRYYAAGQLIATDTTSRSIPLN